jgi:outer membrane protein insertion porin family
MRWIFCAALLCSCLPVSAGQSPDQSSDAKLSEAKSAAKKQPPPGTLRSVVIKGNRLYSSSEIVKESGLTGGQRISALSIEQARLKLQETELFNSVADEYRTSAGTAPAYDVTFQVEENEQLFPMRFERLGVTPEAARAYLKDHVELYADRIPGTEGVLRRYKAAVQQLVAKSNPGLKVKALVSNDDPQQLSVLFTADAPAPTISQVIVTGNQAVDTGTLLRALNEVAIGTAVSDTRIQQILNGTVKPLYASKGYAAVTFPKVETQPDKSNLGVILKVDIKDGPMFKIGSIHFHGSGLDEDQIRSSITFKPGQTFDGEKVDNFRLEEVHSLRKRGMLDANVSVDTQTDDTKRMVNITYNFVPGEVYTFAKLDVQGLDMSTQPVIERLWGEKPGKPFNPDYPEFFLKRVQQQGLFDNLADVHSDYTADASSHNVTVHLYFKGGESQEAKDKKKREEEEKRKNGGWSPY